MRSGKNSEFRINKEGTWYYRDMEMSRRDIVTLFYQHLYRDASGGYFIGVGNQRWGVEVEETAYVVRAVRHSAPQDCFYLILSDDSLEELDPLTLRIGKNNVPYCLVRNRGFDARFSTSGYYQLAEHIRHDPVRNQYYVSVKGQAYYIPEAQND
jgi:hypothetical protein